MGAFSWLRPGNDRQLAEDLSVERRRGHRRSIAKTAAKAEDWEQQDRRRDKQGTSFWSWK